MVLSETNIGEQYVIEDIGVSGVIRRRLQDLGIIPGTLITPIKEASKHGMRAYQVRHSVYALRQETAQNINVKQIEQS